MAENDGIKFNRYVKGEYKEIDITKNYSLKDMNLDAKQRKAIRSVFNAIEYSDRKKGFNEEEKALISDLQTIFAKSGANRNANVLDDTDIDFLKTFKGDINFIKDKLNAIKNAEKAEKNEAEKQQKQPQQKQPLQLLIR